MRAWIWAAVLFVTTLPSFAGDNQAYIDQSGQFSDVYVLQDGVGNGLYGIGGPAIPTNTAAIHGNGNVVTIQQTGSNDQLQLNMETSSMPRPMTNVSCPTCPQPVQGNSWSYNVNGNNAKAVIDVNADGKNTSVSNGMDVTQIGDNAVYNGRFIGDHNSVTVSTTGLNQTVNTSVSGSTNTQTTSAANGSYNIVTVTQSGTNGTAQTNLNGTANIVTVNQTDGAANGHRTNLDISGNSNTIAVNQSSLVADSNINLKTTGSNNVINITSMSR